MAWRRCSNENFSALLQLKNVQQKNAEQKEKSINGFQNARRLACSRSRILPFGSHISTKQISQSNSSLICLIRSDKSEFIGSQH